MKMNKTNHLLEWLFLVALFVPMIVMGKMRLHQRNLAQFLIIGIICVTVIMIVYCFYCKSLPKETEEGSP